MKYVLLFHGNSDSTLRYDIIVCLVINSLTFQYSDSINLFNY